MERDFKGIRIPKEIRLDEDLNIMMKVLLVEIDSLDNEDGCLASNSYFSKFFGISETQISVYIKKLKELGYIEEVGFDGRKRYLRSRIKEKLKSDSKKTLSQPLRKVKGRVKEKLKHNNIDNNINNNIINNTKSEDFEKNKNDIEEYGKSEINLLIKKIKGLCNQYKIAYDKEKERMFAKHICTAKDYGEFCVNIGQDRITFALNVLKASIKINYWKGVCSGPKKIYQNYADVYNKTKLLNNNSEKKSRVAFIPSIYPDEN